MNLLSVPPRCHQLRRVNALAASLTLAIALPLTSAFAAEGGVRPGATASSEFVPLFNRRDLTGWRVSESAVMPKQPPAAWKIENGVIIGLGDGNAMLASQWDYGDFELEFDWMAENDGYDADLFIHGDRLVRFDPIRLTKTLVGGPQETDRGEGDYNAGAKGMIGGGGNARKPVPELQKPAGEWNTWRIVVSGSRYSLTCNGKEAWTCTDHIPRRGYIGFRVYRGPFHLRNIRLSETGFSSLMNMAEWEVYPGFGGKGPLEQHWTTEGRLWTFKGPGPSIVTKRKNFASYHLRVEFLFADPDPKDINSGIYLRGVHPWQADIWEHKWGSGLWGLNHAYVPAKKNLQDLGKVVRPEARMDNPQGHWNYLEVRVENNIVTTWLNGRIAVDHYPVQQADPKFPNTGGIGLQAHWPWKEVRFHNLRIKELK